MAGIVVAAGSEIVAVFVAAIFGLVSVVMVMALVEGGYKEQFSTKFQRPKQY